MSFRIIYSHEFGKEIKKLAKKYPSLKNDFAALLQSLQNQPVQGVFLG
jgi:mRNA-degrading endonuclease RelE of RelBE toxin-antitoxin system